MKGDDKCAGNLLTKAGKYIRSCAYILMGVYLRVRAARRLSAIERRQEVSDWFGEHCVVRVQVWGRRQERTTRSEAGTDVE